MPPSIQCASSSTSWDNEAVTVAFRLLVRKTGDAKAGHYRRDHCQSAEWHRVADGLPPRRSTVRLADDGRDECCGMDREPGDRLGLHLIFERRLISLTGLQKSKRRSRGWQGATVKQWLRRCLLAVTLTLAALPASAKETFFIEQAALLAVYRDVCRQAV